MAGAINAKLSKIVLSRPDLFGICDIATKSKTQLAVYLVSNTISAQLYSAPNTSSVAMKAQEDAAAAAIEGATQVCGCL